MPWTSRTFLWVRDPPFPPAPSKHICRNNDTHCWENCSKYWDKVHMLLDFNGGGGLKNNSTIELVFVFSQLNISRGAALESWMKVSTFFFIPFFITSLLFFFCAQIICLGGGGGWQWGPCVTSGCKHSGMCLIGLIKVHHISRPLPSCLAPSLGVVWFSNESRLDENVTSFAGLLFGLLPSPKPLSLRLSKLWFFFPLQILLPWWWWCCCWAADGPLGWKYDF